MNEFRSHTTEGQDNTAKKSDETQNSLPLGNVPPRIPERPPTPDNHDDARNNSNQPPWWKRLATWQFVAEIAIFIVGVKVACIYSGQLNAMLEANKINRDVFVKGNRPWVGYVIEGNETPKIPDLSHLDNSSKIQFELTLHNFGNSPAVVAKNPNFRIGRWTKTEIRYVLESIASRNGTVTNESVQRTMDDICKVEAVPGPVPGPRFARFLAPIYQGKDGTITAIAIQDSSRSGLPNARYDHFLGCIVYASSDEKRFYRLLLLYTMNPTIVGPVMELKDTQIVDDD